MTIRFAILGAGRIGLVHAQAIASNPQAKLVAVADPFEKSANQLIATYGGEIRSIPQISESEDIDAVLICTPTNTHADLIENFARAGKAMFCEKPIDLSLERVKSCLKVVKENSAKLMVGFNRRFDPHFIALKDTIDTGTIGNVEMVNIVSRDPGPPPYEYIKVSGGIFKDMTIHDFDMARFLLGEEIESVFASASVLVDPKIGELSDFDSANVILTTASGKQCSISNSRRATYGYDQRIEVLGSLGMVSAENQRPVNIEVATSQGFTRPALHDFFMTRYTQAYAAEIASFIGMLADNTEGSPSGDDGLIALAIAQAACISVNTGRSVKLAEVI
jgi:myo-inositol 2-dehydrogenase/D-chiro-inositol 1-dehydrogenase